MKKLALLALLLSCGAAQAQPIGPPIIGCNQIFQVTQGAVALTKIVSSVTGKLISLCGWAANGNGAATVQLQYGTGTNCGTGTTSLTPAVSLAANTSYSDHPGFVFFSLPSGNDLCLVTTGAGTSNVMVYFG